MKSNAQIQKDVYDELKWDPRIHEGDIGVSVSNNVVTLSGNIPSYAEKWAAEEAAQKVSGVNAVVNDINVKAYGLQKHDDQDIAEAAAKAITWNVWVPKDKVKVIVDNGWVTLSGKVASEYQRKAAEDEVKFLSGVRGVTNDVSIEPAVKVKDIKEQIKRALHRYADKDAENIQVSVINDEVQLTGEVHSRSEKNEAGWAAWGTPGVRKVKNNVTVSFS